MPYIVESNLNVREVTVEKQDMEFVIIHFNYNECRLMVRSGRIYETREEAEEHLPYAKFQRSEKCGITGRTPWYYLLDYDERSTANGQEISDIRYRRCHCRGDM